MITGNNRCVSVIGITFDSTATARISAILILILILCRGLTATNTFGARVTFATSFDLVHDRPIDAGRRSQVASADDAPSEPTFSYHGN